MDEIEVKILEINKDEVIQKLVQLGAQKTFDGELINIYLDFENNFLKDNEKAFRLRKQGEKNILNFKKRKSNDGAKISHEIEVEVESDDVILEILKNLGVVEKARDTKERTSFSIGQIHFDIDTYPEIPTFLEIEGHTKKEVLEWVEKLGFSLDQVKTWGRGELMDHYSKS